MKWADIRSGSQRENLQLNCQTFFIKTDNVTSNVFVKNKDKQSTCAVTEKIECLLFQPQTHKVLVPNTILVCTQMRLVHNLNDITSSHQQRALHVTTTNESQVDFYLLACVKNTDIH